MLRELQCICDGLRTAHYIIGKQLLIYKCFLTIICHCIINKFYKHPSTYLFMDMRHQKIVLTILLIAYALVMIIGAIIPNPQDVPVFSGNTKYFHFIGFLVLAMIVLKTFEVYKFKHNYILSMSVLLLFVLLTESLQLLVSTRHYSYIDMLIDIGGCMTGWVIYLWISSKR